MLSVAEKVQLGQTAHARRVRMISLAGKRCAVCRRPAGWDAARYSNTGKLVRVHLIACRDDVVRCTTCARQAHH